MDLYFTRHGRTQWNKELRFQGFNGDSPLLEPSLKEIACLGRYLADIPFQKIYTSPLKRAMHTAQAIKEQLHTTPIIQEDDRLKEMGLGDFEGRKISEMKEQFPEQISALRHYPDRYQPEVFNGETFEHMVERFQAAVYDAIKQASSDQPLLFVSHGAISTAAIHAMIGKSLKDYRQMGGLNNNSLTILTADETKKMPFQLRCYNDTRFLKGAFACASGDELI